MAQALALLTIILIVAPLHLHSHGPHRSQRYDGKCSVQRCSRDDGPEGEGCERRHGGHRSGCRRGVEEEWRLQTRRCAEPEAQEEASDASQERGEPLHKGTMRLQSQACVEDRQGVANEEVQGDGELESHCCEMVSLGRGGRTRQAYYESVVPYCCSITTQVRFKEI